MKTENEDLTGYGNCDHCKHEDVEHNRFPCDDCKHITPTEDRWEPKPKKVEIIRKCRTCRDLHRTGEPCKTCNDSNWMITNRPMWVAKA